MPNRQQIKAGFSPTVDSAILVAALEKGFAADEAVELQLVRKHTPDDVLNAVRLGTVDIAHLPAPFPVACLLGFAGPSLPMVAPFILARGGVAFTVSDTLFHSLMRQRLKVPDPSTLTLALARHCSWRHANALPPLRIAVESRYSAGWYELRYLFAASRIRVPEDIELVAAAPQEMPNLLDTGNIDGFYASEPYGSQAVLNGAAHIVTTKSRLWQNGPEKLLTVRTSWANEHPECLASLLRALYRAGEWCANPRNIEELAGILAAPQYLGVDGELILPVLTGFVPSSQTDIIEFSEFFSTSSKAANFPWQSQALWFFSQMVRWGDCPLGAAADRPLWEQVRDCYRPDIYRRALKPLFAPVPGANLKMEGTLLHPVHVGASRSGLVLGPDMFFDGRIFDPDRFAVYDDR